jgi:NADPH-dependent 2,4-dienoyl-CoA reductase/sulfur reductase-like enzyme/rhodanese-related sulfurtransferase
MTIKEPKQKIVIVGGVALGAGAAAKARRMDENAEIIIIERGPYVSFANCGLPYYLGDEITNRDALLLNTPESLKSRFNIDVRVLEEAVELDRTNKVLTVRKVDSGEEYQLGYDKLVLAMGARPIIPPLPGISLNGVFSLRTVPDVDRIKEWVSSQGAKRAVVIGAGFIGLETVENLASIGVHVTLVEKAPQVLPPFDPEMTALALRELDKLGVEIILGDGIASFEGVDKATSVTLESGRKLEADVFMLGIGVRPENELAKQAGLDLGAAGALQVNEYLQTSDPDIYSGGDMAEIVHLVDGQRRYIPLAGPANKQGRVIGVNVCGGQEKFLGAQGTSIVRVGKATLATTGFAEKTARLLGLNYITSYNTTGHHAGYYPGAKDLTIKLMVEKPSGRLLGAEIAGREGVDKRVDVLATAIAARMTVSDIAALDLAYAPPFSAAKDPVIMAAMAAENVLRGVIDIVHSLDDLRGQDVGVLDVRRDDEVIKGMLAGAVHIPLDELRDRVGELDERKHWIVYCRSGQRSYFATQLLKRVGFPHIYNLSGGYIVQEMKQEVFAKQQQGETDLSKEQVGAR